MNSHGHAVMMSVGDVLGDSVMMSFFVGDTGREYSNESCYESCIIQFEKAVQANLQVLPTNLLAAQKTSLQVEATKPALTSEDR